MLPSAKRRKAFTPQPNRGKVFIFLKNWAPAPSSQAYLGPVHVVAVAWRQEMPPVVSAAALPARQKSHPYFLNPAREPLDFPELRGVAQQALHQLKERLGDNFEILALLSAEKIFEGLRWDPYALVTVPPSSLPRDFHRAEELATTYAAHHQQLLSLEYPDIPWSDATLETHQQALKHFPHAACYAVDHPLLAPHWLELQRRKKLLLHVCCGPDAAGVIEQLKKDYDLVAFWYDPNIQPRAEYDRRVEAFLKVAQIEQVPALVGEYDADRFFETIRGLEHTPEQGAKCSRCYDLRLERAAQEARTQGCDLFTTTLAISPHKVQEKLKNFGELYEKKYGVPYLARNFMKQEGFKDSVIYSRTHAIYRQDYCGCWYSLAEGGPQARHTAQVLGLTEGGSVPQDQLETRYALALKEGHIQEGPHPQDEGNEQRSYG